MAKKLTTFIEKAKKVHGNKYCYDAVEYIGSQVKVTIGCGIHGNFQQPPASHIRGQGCPDCSAKARVTTAEFVEKAKKVHGDRYCYDKVEYERNNVKVKIICAAHGIFLQQPSNHINGTGCPKCGIEKAASAKRHSSKQFIEKAQATHGGRFDYSKVEYRNATTKVIIGCEVHGFYKQTPASHLKTNGCRSCSEDNLRKSTEQFIIDARIIHGDRYCYDKVKYTGARRKVTIGCHKCKSEFKQAPNNHLDNQGCPRCRDSKGEREMAEWFDALDIPYIREHRFKGLPRKPYDFYLPDHNLLIEIDGPHHKRPVNFCGDMEKAKKRLTLTQKSDKLKDKFAKDNGIHLIRIEYQ